MKLTNILSSLTVMLFIMLLLQACKEEKKILGPKITVSKPLQDEEVQINKSFVVKAEFYDKDGLQNISLQAYIKQWKTDSLFFTSVQNAQGVNTFRIDTTLTVTANTHWAYLVFEGKDFDGASSRQIIRVRVTP
ncbi:MAG: hypothetical protein NZM35_10505 [Chitinophagales bacterium]|nr:hypothetical protein [Chitinophagales bacterium]MDW8419761.1 hypothetical protein [Chitinophagales bacterium]